MIPAVNKGSAATSHKPRRELVRRKVKKSPTTTATHEGTSRIKLMPCVSQATMTDSNVHQSQPPAHKPQKPARAAKARDNTITTETASDQKAACSRRGCDGQLAGFTPTVRRTTCRISASTPVVTRIASQLIAPQRSAAGCRRPFAMRHATCKYLR